MAIAYSDLTTALGDLLQVVITSATSATPSNDTNFNNILPRIIDDAEQRIYRELDFVAQRNNFLSTAITQNQRTVSIPSNIVVLQGMSAINNFNARLTNNLTTPFSSPMGQQQVQVIDASAPAIANGDWVNIPSFVGTYNGNLQGPYQIIVPGTNSTTYNIATPNASTNSSPIGVLPTYSMTLGSSVVTVSAPFSGADYYPMVGSVFTVGVATTVGGVPLYGDYVITAVTGVSSFTFDSGVNAFSTQGPLPENGGKVQIQYLGPNPTGTRTRARIVSKDAIDQLWPSDFGNQGVPQYIAIVNNATAILAPTPDQNYIGEFTGIFRPTAMSSTNTTTYLGTFYPDLFLAACMVFAMGYQRDFGAQSDDPKAALSWENLYQERRKSAMEEAQRQKTQSTNWSPFSSTPLSQPARP